MLLCFFLFNFLFWIFICLFWIKQLQIVMVVYATAQLSHTHIHYLSLFRFLSFFLKLINLKWWRIKWRKKSCLDIWHGNDRLCQSKWNYSLGKQKFAYNFNSFLSCCCSSSNCSFNLWLTRFACLSRLINAVCPFDKPLFCSWQFSIHHFHLVLFSCYYIQLQYVDSTHS